jgi:subtilisin family serine protease
MALTSGRVDVIVGLLDGPVARDHPELASERIQGIPKGEDGGCAQASSSACLHGTFVAGILSARRDSSAPAICPDCSLLVRPIFAEAMIEGELLPSATPQQLAAAIAECVDAGARVLNLSAAMGQPSTKDERGLRDALDYAASHGVIVVAAAGNQGTLGSSVITRHPWVIPVVGYGVDGRPTPQSNLGSSVGRRGLGASGEAVTSLSPEGGPRTLGGTSIAAAFVTGAIALLWSVFPAATVAEIKQAIASSRQQRRTSVVPPLLDAWEAYSVLSRISP